MIALPKIDYSVFDTAFGHCALLTSNASITKLFLPQPRLAEVEQSILYYIDATPTPALNKPIVRTVPEGLSHTLEKLKNEITLYFEGEKADFSRFLPLLDLVDLPKFSQAVFQLVSEIPYAQTLSYSQVAKQAGSPKATRVVGNILATNPLPILIPCHRVICSDGSPGGFMGEKYHTASLKAKLLQIEKAAVDSPQILLCKENTSNQ